jgi:hypothetical protein
MAVEAKATENNFLFVFIVLLLYISSYIQQVNVFSKILNDSVFMGIYINPIPISCKKWSRDSFYNMLGP